LHPGASQSLERKPLTIYGEGKQTRSFQYVADLVRGLVALMGSEYSMPCNIGNPDEYSMLEFATKINAKVRVSVSVYRVCVRPACAVLCCAVLCCAVLCCAVLCCAVLCCAVLCCVWWHRCG
jgi:hypothetical protein